MHLRPSIVAALFVVAFAVIANLAWATALGTSGPWFRSTVSLEMYSVTLLAANLLAIVVAAVASHRVAALDDAIRALDLHVAAARDASSAVSNSDVGATTSGEPAPPGDDEVDELLEAIGGFEPAPVVKVERTGHDSLLASPAPAPTTRTGAEVLKEIRRQRMRLRTSRANTWRVAMGPLALSIVYIAAAGAMLPGVEGFAQSHYQLNTAVLLFLGYGWAFLAAWAVLGILMMHAGSPKAAD